MSGHLINTENMRVINLFCPGHTITWAYLTELEWSWDAIPLISSYVEKLGAGLDTSEYDVLPDYVWIHKSATVAPSAYIGSNVIIGADADITVYH